jgi:hypothetical protein
MKKPAIAGFFNRGGAVSRLLGGQFRIVGDQRNQCVLLAPGELTEALQQLPFMQAQLWAVQAHGDAFVQRAFLKHALLKAGDDLGVHAAVVVAGHDSYALAHTLGEANDEFVSRATGIDSLFHRAHTFNRLVQESDAGNKLQDCHRFDCPWQQLFNQFRDSNRYDPQVMKTVH